MFLGAETMTQEDGPGQGLAPSACLLCSFSKPGSPSHWLRALITACSACVQCSLREELKTWCECSLSHNSIGLEPDLLFRQNQGTCGGGRPEGDDLVQCLPVTTIIQKSWETPHTIIFQKEILSSCTGFQNRLL